MLKRILQLQAQMKTDGVEGLLVARDSDVRYLSGEKFEAGSTLLYITCEKQYILTDGRFANQLAQDDTGFLPVIYDPARGSAGLPLYPHPAAGGLKFGRSIVLSFAGCAGPPRRAGRETDFGAGAGRSGGPDGTDAGGAHRAHGRPPDRHGTGRRGRAALRPPFRQRLERRRRLPDVGLRAIGQGLGDFFDRTLARALAGIRSNIPADQVIDAMKQVGELMPRCLKETAQAGLAAAPAAQISKNRKRPEEGTQHV